MRNFSMAEDAVTGSPRGPYKLSPEELAKFGTGGIKLRQWRAFRGLTIPILALKAGVSAGTISQIENAETGWGDNMIIDLSNALEIEPAMLLGVNPLEKPEFWELWNRADPGQKLRINDYALGVVGVAAKLPTKG